MNGTPVNARRGRLQDKVAFISGGGGGIGEAAARMFAREGASVAIADIRQEAADAVARSVIEAGGQAFACAMDATSETSVQAAFAAARERFGRLDVLFNCIGGSVPADAPITEVDLSVWTHTMELDVKGTILCCRHAIPQLIEAGGGSIVNMSSGAALRGSSRSHIYTAAKGAVVSLTRALAGTYAKHRIRVNAICSGRVNTERVRRTYGIPGQPGDSVDPMRVDEQVKTYPFWFGEPDDMAAIALFLASDESLMITGAAIPADGGRSAY
jgi:NAD(P)-dependent dehydrogenase (short-subunit alcohol dehydrogenase family)